MLLGPPVPRGLPLQPWRSKQKFWESWSYRSYLWWMWFFYSYIIAVLFPALKLTLVFSWELLLLLCYFDKYPKKWNTCQTANDRIISVLKGENVNINTSFKKILKLSTSTHYQPSPKRYFATNWCLYVVYSPVSPSISAHFSPADSLLRTAMMPQTAHLYGSQTVQISNSPGFLIGYTWKPHQVLSKMPPVHMFVGLQKDRNNLEFNNFANLYDSFFIQYFHQKIPKGANIIGM